MNWLELLLATDFAHRLGWTLIHSLWQGVLIASLLAMVMAMVPRRLANIRYSLSCLALVSVVVMFCITLGMIPEKVDEIAFELAAPPSTAIAENTSNDFPASVATDAPKEIESASPVEVGAVPIPAEIESVPAQQAPSLTLSQRAADWVQLQIAWLVPVWFLGVFALSIWHFGGWIAMRRLRIIGTAPASTRFVKMMNDLAGQLGIKQSVQLLQSVVVKTPIVIGWIKPIILMPACILNELSPAQLESILAHELAHIRRYDYLVNWLQTIVETLMFHHPAVWWISNHIRNEREYCCDDTVVGLTSDQLNYAQALTTIADLRQSSPSLAVAASGGSLLSRIQRILGLSSNQSLSHHSWLVGVMALVLCIAIPFGVMNAQGNVASENNNTEVDSKVDKADVGTAETNPVVIKTHQAIQATAGDPTFVLPDHRYVKSLGFSPDSKFLVSVSWGNAPDHDGIRFAIRTWDVAERKLTREVELEWNQNWNRSTSNLMLSKDRTKVISILDGQQIGIWDAATGKLIRRLELPKDLQNDKRYVASLSALVCTPDLSRIACGRSVSRGLAPERGLAPDAHAIVWNANTGRVVQVVKLKHTIHVQSLSLSADGKRLAAVGMQHGTQIWEVSSGKMLLYFRNTNPDRKHPDPEVKDSTLKMVLDVSFSPDGKLLAIGDMLGVKLIDSKSGELLRRIDAPFRYHSGHSSFVFSADSQLLARMGTCMKLGESRTDRVTPIWSTKTGQLIMSLPTEADDVSFSSNGKWAAVGFSDRKQAVAVWQIKGENSGAADKADVGKAKASWGKAVDGLQAGLATAISTPRPYQLGQNAPLQYLVRNTSDKPITLTHERVPVFINWSNYRQTPGTQLFGSDGKQVFPASGVGGIGLPGKRTRTIAPGEVICLTTVRVPLRAEGWKGTTVNTLAYCVKPGKHQISLSHTFGDQGGKHWGGTLATGMLDLYVHAVNAPLSIPGNPWGKYNDEIRCRLNTDKTRLGSGEPPILMVDVQNHGRNTLEQIWHELEFKLEVDGKWTGKLSPNEVRGQVAHLTPEQEWINIPLTLQDKRYHMAATSSAPGGPAIFSKLMGLGRHTIRIDIDGSISNPVEIEVIAEDGGQSTGEVSKANVGKTETSWGKVVNGMPAITLVPSMPTVRSLADLRVISHAINAHNSEDRVKTSHLEIRSVAGPDGFSRKPVFRTRVAFPWPWSKSPENPPVGSDGKPWPMWGERSKVFTLNDSQLRWVGKLPDGEYQLAWVINGRRLSNTMSFQIDRGYDIAQELLLDLSIVPAAPAVSRNGQIIPGKRYLILRYSRRAENDPAFKSSQVAYATLIADEQKCNVNMISWTGPDGPPPIGKYVTYLLDLDNYRPLINHSRTKVVVATIGEHMSNIVKLSGFVTAKKAQDRDLAEQTPLVIPPISLAGLVIGSDGKPTSGYVVYIEHEQWAERLGDLPHETTDENGQFVYHNLPDGKCAVIATPKGKGQPLLRINGVVLKKGKPAKVQLSFEHKFKISGHVTDATGQPVLGRDVMATWKSQDGKAEFIDFSTTDLKGEYVLGSPFPIAKYIGLGGTGKQPKPHRNVKHGRKNVDFQVKGKDTDAADKADVGKAETPWGKAIDGVRMRVTKSKFTIAQGEKIDLRVDIHNGGKVDRKIDLEHEAWELEIDGKWLKVTGGVEGDRHRLPLTAGQMQRNVEVTPWLWENMTEALKNLKPGKHTLRVARLLNGEGRSLKNPPQIRIVSQPFEIKIKAGKTDVGKAVDGVHAKPWDFDDAAKKLTEAVGGRWRVASRERAPGLGLELSSSLSAWHGVSVPYIVFPFPLNDEGRAKLDTFLRLCSVALDIVASDDRWTVLAGPSREPDVTNKILRTLAMATSKETEQRRRMHAQADWLDFRLAVAKHSSRKGDMPLPLSDGPNATQIAEYKDYFASKGPNGGRHRGDPHQWFWELDICDASPLLVRTVDRSGAGYLLLSNKLEDILLSGSARPRPWHLKRVYTTRDARGHFAIVMEFDEKAARRMSKLTRNNVGRPLAVLFDGNVLAVHTVRAELTDRIILSGGPKGFDSKLAKRIIRSLSECMLPKDTAKKLPKVHVTLTKKNGQSQVVGSDLESGKVLWRINLSAVEVSSERKGRIEVKLDDGRKVILDSKTGKVISTNGKHPDNPLGLDDKALIKLFRAGAVLRNVAFDCESFYHDRKRLPKDVPDLASRYQVQSRVGIGNDPFASGKKLRLILDDKRPNVVKVWSVGPDGKWDGGKQIDSTHQPLTGDLGVEIRVGRTDWHWLADKMMQRNLEGKRLAHYLAARGKKLPKPKLKDDGLKWGPVVDGLQLAVELKPKKQAYLLGETIDVHFHVRNAANYAIQVGLAIPMRQDMTERSVFIRDKNGKRLIGKSTWFSGTVGSKQHILKPGQSASYDSSDLAFVAPGKRSGTDAVGHWVEAASGVYTLQFKQHFPISYGNEPREWQGVLETAPVTVHIAKQPKFAIYRVRAYRKPGDRPGMVKTIYLRDSGKPERFDSMRPERYPLKDLVIDDTPLLTEADMLAYDLRNHTIKLKPGVHQRLSKAIKQSVWGVPFVVQAEGESIYLGAFWTPVSSYMADMPTITLMNFNSSLPKNDPEYLPKDAIRIENSQVLKEGELISDPRQNKRLYKALRKTGKLLDLRSGELPWGKTVEKVQSRLRPGVFRNGFQWLRFDLRNDSGNLSIQLGPAGGMPTDILIDNVEYRWSGRVAGKMSICKPGQRVTGAHIKLDENWTRTVGNAEALKLTPGKHKVQALVYAAEKRTGNSSVQVRGKKRAVLSNPVEIEIVVTNKDKGTGAKDKADVVNTKTS